MSALEDDRHQSLAFRARLLRLGLENEALEEEAGDISLPNEDSKQIPCTVQYIVGFTPIKCFVFHRPHNPFVEMKTEKVPKTARISLIQNIKAV